ncbi:rhodanese-like domain-containing protein [Rhodohalobacter sp. 8-1]|uniref:rhodanese-like domain-containing protein n=1 Tax=Rhodohalobacter sp. 8-1 TaxID=3131972 RepID=UPI0030EEAAC6
MNTLSANDVRESMNSTEDTILVNTLDADSFQAKHIPGSINIPTAKIDNIAGTVLPDKNQEIIVYCANEDCTASPEAAEKLEGMGYTNVYDFEAGLSGWLKSKFDLVKKED